MMLNAATLKSVTVQLSLLEEMFHDEVALMASRTNPLAPFHLGINSSHTSRASLY